MNNIFRTEKFSAAILAALTVVVLCAASSNAQTKRRPKLHKKPTHPAAVAPIYAPNGDAIIVSRAADYQTENKPPEPILIEPTETPAAETPETSDQQITQLKDRIKSLEAKPANEYDQKQKRLLLNLDILTRAETRAESLRKQLFDLVEKESDIKLKLDRIENDSRSENIDRAVAFAGTLRPEELRDMRAKNLESEKQSLQTLLTNIQETKTNLETNVQRADQLVEKLRTKLEKDINDSLTEEPKN